MEKIIIATDLNEMATSVIETGFKLARKLNAAVDLLCVVDKEFNLLAESTGFVFDNQWAERLASATEQLTKIQNENKDLEIKVVAYIGYPKTDILSHITNESASFIVLGTHGRSGFTQLLMGGTAEYIVRHSTIPVVVVPYNISKH